MPRPGRTGVVIGALGAGVALMFQTAGVGRSNEEPVVEWIAQVVQADHFVFSGNMTAANSSNSPMAESVARDLRAAARGRSRDDHPLLAPGVQRHDRLPHRDGRGRVRPGDPRTACRPACRTWRSSSRCRAPTTCS